MSEEQTPVEVNTDLIAAAMHKLSINNLCVTDTLMDCNIYLNKLNRSDVVRAVQLIDINLVFDCLNTTDEIQLKTTCALLEKLLLVLPPNDVFTKYSVSIERSLHHPNSVVLGSILSHLDKILAVDSNVDIQVDLACTIVECLNTSHTTVSYNAAKCLKRLRCIKVLSSLPIVTKLLGLVAIDAQIRTRVYDVLIHWADSVETLALIGSRGLFSNLVSDITSPDLMMQLVMIQMIIPLATTQHGFDYLNSVGVVGELYHLLSSDPNDFSDPSIVILSPSVLEFFISVTKVRPHFVYTTYPRVFTVMYEVLKGGFDTSAAVVINSIISLASSWDCKIVLDTDTAGDVCGYRGDEKLDLWSVLIIELSRIATSTNPDLKEKAIQAITKIIQIEDDGSVSKERMMECTEKWYKRMQNNPIKNIVYASCVLPFYDLQEAGFEMLLALAEQPWGQIELNEFPALLHLVFDKKPTDPIDMICLKNKIVQTILKSDTSKHIFNEEILSSLQYCVAEQSNRNLNRNDEVMVDDMAM